MNYVISTLYRQHKKMTGKGPEEFKKLADKKGLTKNGEIKDGV